MCYKLIYWESLVKDPSSKTTFKLFAISVNKTFKHSCITIYLHLSYIPTKNILCTTQDSNVLWPVNPCCRESSDMSFCSSAAEAGDPSSPEPTGEGGDITLFAGSTQHCLAQAPTYTKTLDSQGLAFSTTVFYFSFHWINGVFFAL